MVANLDLRRYRAPRPSEIPWSFRDASIIIGVRRGSTLSRSGLRPVWYSASGSQPDPPPRLGWWSAAACSASPRSTAERDRPTSPPPMPLPFDAVGQAVGAATWLVGVVAERLVGDRVAAWAERRGVAQEEVARLRAELRRANLVLGAARAGAGGGRRIGNEQLAEPIAAVRRLAADARSLLDELDYLDIHDKIKDKEHASSGPSSSKAQSILRFAYGFANQTSKYISSAVKISAMNSKEDHPSSSKRRIERHDIMSGIKRMKLSDSDDQISGETELEGETVLDGAPEGNLSKDDISQRITAIVDQLHEICEDVRKALKQDKIDEITRAAHSAVSDSREEAACYTETKVFAREDEKKDAVKLITSISASDQKIVVLPIIGSGGVGKTTFARLVYNDEEVKRKFDARIWIYVSATFDEVRLSEEILECISEGMHKSMPKNLSMLQDAIKKYLTKRFLLVLDDVWEENERRWEKLLAPLRCTEITGNVILVTTRIKSVTKILNIVEHINLDGLKDDVFWRFFKRCIFGDENYQGRRKLQKIGKEIVPRLKGNPLAAKSVSTLLKRRLEEDYWQRISDGDEWKLQVDSDDIMPALMLSYNHLPYHLQRLFSYCALFPKGYKFNKEQLVRIWIALGFITDGRKRTEDTASDYFDDLVDRSFFEKIEEPQEDVYYLMHDLISDLAQVVSVDECLIVDGSGPQTVSRYVNHVSIWTEAAYKKKQNGEIEPNEDFDKGLTAIQENDILRSLDSLVLVGSYDRTSAVTFAKILRQLKCVRVLRLSALFLSADILQTGIAKFIHLRYLELRSTADTLKCLPESICRLYHLQVLDIRDCCGLTDLPRDMCNLVNLRYLFVPESGTLHLHSKIVRVGELKFLQELKEFHVKAESGFEISQLEYLNEIRGSLRIFNLDNVIEKNETSRARMKDKKHLRTLSLSWGSKRGNFPKEALEGLLPNDRLEHLYIINYTGVTPSWLGENFTLNNLESLYLHGCTGMETLPPFNQLPFLEKLSLVGMSSLKEVKFDFDHASASRGSDSSEEDMSDLDDFALTDLEICKCPMLTSLSLLSCKALAKLSIKDCVVLASIHGLQSLDQLELCEIKDCPCFPHSPDIERLFQRTRI
ncbi:hypothetical protein BS78_05G083400 [Paspalum vaginatum]|nr:hypothetical protein BS78_05G083400 [Paspalum vaginatum]KAJ1274730.1 hypothetical protein BS78_05G083400 [Paspalum vaginatum]